MDSQPHILVVDDHQEIRTLLQRFLTDHGYRITTASNGVEMKKRLQDAAIDLIVLDLMMPGEDGLTLCRNLRAESNIPVIMLTAMGEETDRIIGLEMGADDYLAKPFNPRELLARIKAVMRRIGTMPEVSREELSQQLNFLGWTLRPASRELTDPQQTLVPLSTAEFTLLMAFVTRPGRVLSRDQLLDLARGREARAFDRAIDTLVSRLRRKLRDQPRNPQIIKTVRGGGYLFAAKVENNNASLA
ncbi:MAG: response regulator [Candidatus Thiodiazotropha lotti]|uniref:response regulator n=1 Tax=Candidatus Thiodiazotropha endoloripes TaxID=1818881 RepID=UPI00083CEE95|nr:response regulator [Candidatus Thiodiazotropha endoloripes]MCG7991815.1 response regulator [Candidatus Thiodiazotropha lotti]MCW4183473.1 response regulator [Candidatus Thiodiazotropha weberae]MCG8000456.1 response regulator [Candidatus Thiodiazotropha lotti]MCW4192226.1 response regulator [Candidatus Thiodiazotropha weberae]ODB91625.1 DNA-binding response regulator [Candidatus Thiodiazotropha endoloripes]